MSIFEADRDLVVELTDKDAHEVLGLLDGRLTHRKASSEFRTPSEVRAALKVANRSPDVSRYFLVEKAQRYVDEHVHRGEGVE